MDVLFYPLKPWVYFFSMIHSASQAHFFDIHERPKMLLWLLLLSDTLQCTMLKKESKARTCDWALPWWLSPCAFQATPSFFNVPPQSKPRCRTSKGTSPQPASLATFVCTRGIHLTLTYHPCISPLQRVPFSINITESQNSLGWKGPQRSLSSNPSVMGRHTSP